MINFKPKANTHLVSCEMAHCKKFLNRLNKWPSMPILQGHNKQHRVSRTETDIERTKVYSSHPMSLSSPTCVLIDISMQGSEFKSTIDKCDAGHLAHPFNSNDDEFIARKRILGSQNIKSENRGNSSISLQTSEFTIDRCKIFESEESVSEQLFDASLLFDESDTTSLVNVLNTLKFNNEYCSTQHFDINRKKERRQLENRCDNTIFPLKNNGNLCYIREDRTRRKLNNSNSKSFLIDQENKLESDEKVLSVNDSFSKEYLMQFKDRLREIRKENMSSPMTNKPIHKRK